MQVLHVCSEMFPLLKTGGLADVLGALPAAQIAGGVDTRVLLPAFPDIRRGIPDAKVVTRRETFAGRITLLFGHYNGVGIYLIDAPHLYDRPGSPYHDTNLFAYTDNSPEGNLEREKFRAQFIRSQTGLGVEQGRAH